MCPTPPSLGNKSSLPSFKRRLKLGDFASGHTPSGITRMRTGFCLKPVSHHSVTMPLAPGSCFKPPQRPVQLAQLPASYQSLPLRHPLQPAVLPVLPARESMSSHSCCQWQRGSEKAKCPLPSKQLVPESLPGFPGSCQKLLGESMHLAVMYYFHR